MSITQNIEPNKLNIEAGAAPKTSKIEAAFSKYNLNIGDRPCRKLCAPSLPRKCLKTTP